MNLSADKNASFLRSFNILVDIRGCRWHAKTCFLALLMSENTEQAISYPVRGASKSMIRSVNELARQADAYLEGETYRRSRSRKHRRSRSSLIVWGTTASSIEELLQAIREHGQNSPILVRPHPLVDGRYMVVFGHRRVRVARELGRKVRSVVKAVDDKAHVIAQGQENSARSNLTFIEKSTFAKRLEALGYDREIDFVGVGSKCGRCVENGFCRFTHPGSYHSTDRLRTGHWSRTLGGAFAAHSRRNWMWSKSTWLVARSTTWRATIASSGYWRLSMPRASRFERHRQR